MKYLAAFVIGVGLIVYNPALAESLDFDGNGIDAPITECLEASARGFKLQERYDAGPEYNSGYNEQHFLIRGFGLRVTWRVYRMFFYTEQGRHTVACSYKPLIQ